MTPAIITDRDGLRVVVDPEGGSSARPAIHVWHANVRLTLDRIDPLCRKDRAQLLDLAVGKADRCGFELDREALKRFLEDARPSGAGTVRSTLRFGASRRPARQVGPPGPTGHGSGVPKGRARVRQRKRGPSAARHPATVLRSQM